MKKEDIEKWFGSNFGSVWSYGDWGGRDYNSKSFQNFEDFKVFYENLKK